MDVLGIDVGGSGIKSAPVDTATGTLHAERFRIPTPQPAAPQAMLDIIAEQIAHWEWDGPIGCGFPAVIQHGMVRTAANIDPKWIDINIEEEILRVAGKRARVLNDADAAGLAEMRWGAGVAHEGVVLMLTFGTGIGSALFVDGVLVPNTEFGHIEVRGKEGEARAADSVRERKQLSWRHWAKRVDEYIDTLERLVWPDLIIVGGGVSKEADHWLPLLHTRAPIVAAQMLNNAGIAGAALAATSHEA
jgi:polyphosphate glucokinase